MLNVAKLRERMNSTHCCYALLDAFGKWLYVGQTGNLRQRIADHKSRKRIPFVDWIHWRCLEGEKYYLEAELIYKHRPPFNKYLLNSASPSHDKHHILRSNNLAVRPTIPQPTITRRV